MKDKNKKQIKKEGHAVRDIVWTIFGILLLSGLSYASVLSDTILHVLVVNATTVNATTFYGDGSQLTGISSASNTNSTFNASRLNNGLTGYYGFDENGQGSITQYAYDSSRNNNTGVLGNATLSDPFQPIWIAGISNSGLEWNGTNAYVQLENSAGEIYNANNITVSTWVNWKGSADTTDNPYILSHSVTGTPGNRILIYVVNSTGELQTRFGLNTAFGFYNLTKNQWTHIAVRYSFNSSFDTFINGNFMNTTLGSTAITTVADIKIGAGSSAGQYWNGTIDEFKFYNRYLSNDEIRALSLGLGGPATGQFAIK